MLRYQKFKIEMELEEDFPDWKSEELLKIFNESLNTNLSRINLVEEME